MYDIYILLINVMFGSKCTVVCSKVFILPSLKVVEMLRNSSGSFVRGYSHVFYIYLPQS